MKTLELIAGKLNLSMGELLFRGRKFHSSSRTSLNGIPEEIARTNGLGRLFCCMDGCPRSLPFGDKPFDTCKTEGGELFGVPHLRPCRFSQKYFLGFSHFLCAGFSFLLSRYSRELRRFQRMGMRENGHTVKRFSKRRWRNICPVRAAP